MDIYFDFGTDPLLAEMHKLEMQVADEKTWHPLSSTIQLWRIQERIDEHIRTAPEREAAALRRANLLEAISARATGSRASC